MPTYYRRDPPRRSWLPIVAVGLPVCVIVAAMIKYAIEVMR
jgi:hypothetical protein